MDWAIKILNQLYRVEPEDQLPSAADSENTPKKSTGTIRDSIEYSRLQVSLFTYRLLCGFCKRSERRQFRLLKKGQKLLSDQLDVRRLIETQRTVQTLKYLLLTSRQRKLMRL